MDFYSNISATSSPVASSIYPTIFEVLSSEEIDELLTPSVRYIVANIVARKPNKYTLAINNWFDEWFLLAGRLILESHSLSKWDGTFIEKFYGLKRFNGANSVLLRTLQRNQGVDLPMRLRKQQRLAVLFQKVFVPYLVTKLDQAHSKLLARAFVSARDSVEDFNVRLLRRMQSAFIKFYPLLKKLMFLANLAIKLYFLSGKTGSTSLIDFILNIQYTRLSKFDYQRNELSETTNMHASNLSRRKNINNPALLFLLKMWGSKVGSVLKSSASQIFPAFIFLLRVFQWWTSEDISGGLQRSLDNIDEEVPPPPIPFEKNEDGKCRICGGAIQNPAAIGTGYVFCYPCIMQYLPQHEGKCPVTGSRLLGCAYDSNSGIWSITGIRKLLI
ncbi:LADA_0G12970g1_1 [Lachancea dasiensis]|uniref:Peroxisome assembly protein 12 n=1 Tax=Lachancea dasiensis TaxID=1072105 RepID=A0A1G4JVG6_9SACH|nr:LADA_0G12970g1_1 [Lachancea dasiensis]